MNTQYKRWIGLTGATTLALSGFGVLGAAATAEDRPPLPWPAVEQKGASDLTYSLDGFEIGHLPPGLSRYNVSAKSSTGGKGERSSQITWVDGPDSVYGKVGVIRSKDIKTLGDLHKAHFDHLDDASLEKVKNNKADAYLSQESGDLFWLDKPGVAVTTHLQPDKWDAKELSRFAGSVRPTNASQDAAPKPEQNPEKPGKGKDVSEVSTEKDTPDTADTAGKPAESAKPKDPRPGEKQSATPKPKEAQPAPEESATPKPKESTPPKGKPAKPGSEDAQALPEGVPAKHVQICVAEQLVADGDGDTSGAKGKNGEDAAPDQAAIAKLWRDADGNGREDAARACAKRFDLRDWQVDTVMNALVDKADAKADDTDEAAKPDKDGSTSGENAAAPRPYTP